MSRKSTERSGAISFVHGAMGEASVATSRRRRIGLRCAALCMATAVVGVPFAAISKVGAYTSAATLHTLDNSVAAQRNKEGLISAQDGTLNGPAVVGQPHSMQELAQAQNEAKEWDRTLDGAVVAEEALIGLAGIGVAMTTAGGTWRRRRAIVNGVRRMAGAVAQTARHAWDVFNEPIGVMSAEAARQYQPRHALPDGVRSMIFPDRMPDPLDFQVSRAVPVVGLEPELAFGF